MRVSGATPKAQSLTARDTKSLVARYAKDVFGEEPSVVQIHESGMLEFHVKGMKKYTFIETIHRHFAGDKDGKRPRQAT